MMKNPAPDCPSLDTLDPAAYRRSLKELAIRSSARRFSPAKSGTPAIVFGDG